MADDKKAPVTPEPEPVKEPPVKDGDADRQKMVTLDRHLEEETKWKSKHKQLEDQVAEFHKKEEDAKKAKLDEVERLKLERDEAQKQAGRAAKLEEKIKSTLERAKEQIPEAKRSLIPDSLSPEDQLEYIERNREHLMDVPKSPPVNTSKPGDKPKDKIITLNPEQEKVAEYLARSLKRPVEEMRAKVASGQAS